MDATAEKRGARSGSINSEEADDEARDRVHRARNESRDLAIDWLMQKSRESLEGKMV